MTEQAALDRLLVAGRRPPPHDRMLRLRPEVALLAVRALLIARPALTTEDLRDALREVGIPVDVWTKAAVESFADPYRARPSRLIRFLRRQPDVDRWLRG